WDPVENAALMPWLAATAYLHSVMIQEKRGMLRVWNMVLVALAFCLSIFGTFLTRSGVVQSIHSFSQSPLGGWFLAFICVVAAGAGSSDVGLIAYSFSVFVLASIVLEFARGTRARKALGSGTWPGAFSSLVARNRRRYGGYIVHAAIVFLAIGVAGSSAYQTVREGKLSPGGSLQAAGYTLTYRQLSTATVGNHEEVRAAVDLARGGHNVARL